MPDKSVMGNLEWLVKTKSKEFKEEELWDEVKAVQSKIDVILGLPGTLDAYNINLLYRNRDSIDSICKKNKVIFGMGPRKKAYSAIKERKVQDYEVHNEFIDETVAYVGLVESYPEEIESPELLETWRKKLDEMVYVFQAWGDLKSRGIVIKLRNSPFLKDDYDGQYKSPEYEALAEKYKHMRNSNLVVKDGKGFLEIPEETSPREEKKEERDYARDISQSSSLPEGAPFDGSFFKEGPYEDGTKDEIKPKDDERLRTLLEKGKPKHVPKPDQKGAYKFLSKSVKYLWAPLAAMVAYHQGLDLMDNIMNFDHLAMRAGLIGVGSVITSSIPSKRLPDRHFLSSLAMALCYKGGYVFSDVFYMDAMDVLKLPDLYMAPTVGAMVGGTYRVLRNVTERLGPQ